MTFQFFVPLARLNSRVMMLFQESTLFQKHFYLWWEGRDVWAVLISFFFSSVNTILIWAPRKISAQFHYAYSSWIEKKNGKNNRLLLRKELLFYDYGMWLCSNLTEHHPLRFEISALSPFVPLPSTSCKWRVWAICCLSTDVPNQMLKVWTCQTFDICVMNFGMTQTNTASKRKLIHC